MGCVHKASHTKSNMLPQNSLDTTINFSNSVPFNKNVSMISSQQSFNPDPNYIESRKKKVAEFAMHFRIESIMILINKSMPFEAVTELDLSKF